ncbi:MAG TPA: phosphoglycerate kinase [Rhodospirillaceae bacterium]|nr:phosphoglycerate kinase [Rhodospirillaceae bacterium]HAA93426.1 phosphoglycerate kinase [Rhodospirillaceae bacterium]HAT34552.1 phosphoglycerate kinase [Rhodospirillaceae bacterium]
MFKTLDDIDVTAKRILVRADLNVPVQDGAVSDVTRLERLKPTLDRLIEKGARVVVMSHFGRPKGKVVKEMSLAPVAEALSKVMGGMPVAFASDCIGTEAAKVVDALKEGEIAVLENLRFHPGEEANDPAFAAELAKLGDFYVNDGFSVSHRAHASTTAIAKILPSVAGVNMQAELDALGAALERPTRPVGAIVGGAKISTKLDVLGHLVDRMDFLVIGGAMANTFLHALGTDVGASLSEKELADTATAIMAKANDVGCEIVLPSDAVVASELAPDTPTETVQVGGVPQAMMILDLGPESAAGLAVKLAECRTLLWNGPLGAFEVPPFDQCTNTVARVAGELTKAGELISIAGGGDTVAALNRAGVAGDFTYVSTAGGAFLEWLEGKELPGVAALGGTA